MKDRSAHLRSLLAQNAHWLAVAALAILGFFWWSLSHVPPNTIVLKKDGFHPSELTIAPGTTVTFVNATGEAFWPASDSHPQHDLYMGFDAGHPVLPGESWSFAFDREGRWGFHDHLRSYYTGTLYVGEEAAAYDCAEHLSEMNLSQKRECWDNTLADTLRADGAAAAFKQFAGFYESDPEFTQIGCHLIAHAMGDVAYGEYVRSGGDESTLQFPPESVYCGYGYYHGILEHMIRDDPDFAKADAFCRKLVAEHEDTVPRIRDNCYHAIGHGFIPEPTDVETWGNAHELPAPAIAACKNLAETNLRSECMQGAFNVIADWMWNNQFGLRMPEDDSLALCRSFDDAEVSNACYYELSMKVLPYAGTDIVKVYDKYVARIADDYVAGMVVNSAMAGIISTRITEEDFVPYLKQCRTLPERVRVDCLKGITGAFIAHGDPEKEHVKALAFCGDGALTLDEKETCYFNIFRTFKGAYSPEKVASLCASVDERYRHYCAYDS